MSRPEFAVEPSMEEILDSIRKMISDEPAGMPPVPDPFPPTSAVAGAANGVGVDRWDGRAGPLSSPPERPIHNYNRLSEALKSASTPSFEPTRTLEEEIAEMLGRASEVAEVPYESSAPVTPIGGRDAQDFAAVSSAIGRPLDMPAAPNPDSAPRVIAEPEMVSFALDESNLAFEQQQPDVSAEAAGENLAADEVGAIDGKLDDIEASVEIKTVEPLPAEPEEQAQSAESAKPEPEPTPQSVPLMDAFALRAQEPKRQTETGGAARAKVRSSRTAPASSGLNGATISPIRPRPVVVERVPSGPSPAGTPAEVSVQPGAAGTKAGSAAARPAGPAVQDQAQAAKPAKQHGAPSEALVDAVVDLVQKDPGSMSVFTSGSDFIHGVGHPHHDPDSPVHKIDGAAAELLRPMLRQWLSDNMPRIVEEALRSELTSSSSSDKDSSSSDK